MPLELYVPPQRSALHVRVLLARGPDGQLQPAGCVRILDQGGRVALLIDRHCAPGPYDTAAFPSRNGCLGGRGAECRNGRGSTLCTAARSRRSLARTSNSRRPVGGSRLAGDQLAAGSVEAAVSIAIDQSRAADDVRVRRGLRSRRFRSAPTKQHSDPDRRAVGEARVSLTQIGVGDTDAWDETGASRGRRRTGPPRVALIVRCATLLRAPQDDRSARRSRSDASERTARSPQRQ